MGDGEMTRKATPPDEVEPEDVTMVGVDEVTRRKLLASVAGAVTVGALAGVPVAAEAATERSSVGAPRAGRNALELVGRIDQDGLDLRGYGILTHVAGLDAAQVFTDAQDQSPGNARFTFVGQAKINGRSIVEDVRSLSADGTLTLHLISEGGADFGYPDSFAKGIEVASYDMRLQSLLAVRAPNQADWELVGELTQKQAPRFTLLGRRYVIGRRGLAERLEAFGQASRTDATTPKSNVRLAGNVVVAAP